MIEYSRGPYGANLLFRWHGSALAKAFIPGLLSVAIYLALHYSRYNGNRRRAADGQDEYLDHPYAIGVLVSSVSFLIIFRANYGYQRYWEACTMVHKLMSKWMDSAVFAAVFHLQSEHYKDMRPPSFFDHEELNGMDLTRDRERRRYAAGGCAPAAGAGAKDDNDNNPADVAEDCQRAAEVLASSKTLRRRRYVKSINETEDTRDYTRTNSEAASYRTDETHLLGPPRLDGGWGLMYPNQINGAPTNTYYDGGDGTARDDGRGFASTRGGRTPSLFLQELAHLSSLLCAVALTTLRNDLDDVESPLDVYVPGQPWPVADPNQLPHEVKMQAYHHRRFARNVRYLLGIDQTKHARTIYNAARPMLVLGGVSDNEIAFLQRARGPYAKTQLVWSWLSDFIIREHLAGSMGKVGAPIISRIIQFMSDGILYYNHARKIMFTPFPFPHAQLSAFFVLAMMVAIPFLMDQYANEVWLGGTLSFLAVTCLAGLHEVARELENPFRNAPNDVPLCTLLAYYNEALVTMYAGFHPDAYWDRADVVTKRKGEGGTRKGGDDAPILLPELPEEGGNGGDDGGAEAPTTPAETPVPAAVPQSPEDAESLRELRAMIEAQARKIRELQDRVTERVPAPPLAP